MTRPPSGPTGRKIGQKVRRKSKLKASSRRWIERHLNDPYVQQAKQEGYRSRAVYKLLEIDQKHKILDKANDQLWGGAFSLWGEHKLMVYRYGLVMAGGGCATAGQVEAMMRQAIDASERFYPAFQLVCWGDSPAEEALEIAITGAYGRA